MRARGSAATALAMALGVLAAGPGEAGHEPSFYPSFYPQEVRLSILDRAAAASALRKKALHAYIGSDPFAGTAAPAHIAYATSFGSYVVLTFTGAAGRFGDAAARCAAAGRVARALAGGHGDVVVHPYPVTPYHGDYLQHFDRAQAAWAELDPGPPSPGPRLRATGSLAVALRRAGLTVADGNADAALDEIPLAELLGPEAPRLDGWASAPWRGGGWFHAYLLMGDAVSDPTLRREVEEVVRRRTGGDAASAVDRANGERRLVSLLTRGCRRLALGYTLRRQAFNDDYSDGIENLVVDAHGGLGSGLFFRTVKLKDFPWNGWLQVGVEDKPAGAWNPVAGFTDGTGRLLWSIVGDPALLPAPRRAGWIANRVHPLSIETPEAAIEIPIDAVRPDGVTGALRPVGPGVMARSKGVYRVLSSAFHDGTEMSPADILYPWVFAARWSGRDPAVARATALTRARLAGARVTRVDTEIKVLDDVQVLHERPQVEVYLTDVPDPAEAEVVAPPWSAVPWHLTVLMEEAVERGLAAFSRGEADRRGVPWLDLARDSRLRAGLEALLDGFERRGWVPEALREQVTVDLARQRWAALRRFARAHGHLLVTNGPYRLERWSSHEVVLSVVRDFSYPLAVGAYDRFAIPRRAFVAWSEQRGRRITIRAEVERIARAGRSHAIVREPYRGEPAGQSLPGAIPVVHYAVIGPGEQVVALGTSQALEGDTLIVDPQDGIAPGAYRVMMALAVDGNLVNPEVKVIPYHAID